jgi:hypothetical protein
VHAVWDLFGIWDIRHDYHVSLFEIGSFYSHDEHDWE